ncbi:MAG: hypothetical protein ISP71_03270 [Flavobacteriales bacterium]|nr:hypothetical protein [Flavobacteriales bacterium]
MKKYIIISIFAILLTSCKLLIGYKSSINYNKNEVFVKALNYGIPKEKVFLKNTFPISTHFVGLDLYNSKGELIHLPLFDSCSYSPINFILNLDSTTNISALSSKTHELYHTNLALFEKLIPPQLEKSASDFNIIFYWSYKFYGPTKLFFRRLGQAINQHPHLKFNIVYVNTDN